MLEESPKDVTPPVPPSPIIYPEIPGKSEASACLWFLEEKNFCNKVKRSVGCRGDLSKCPFCK